MKQYVDRPSGEPPRLDVGDRQPSLSQRRIGGCSRSGHESCGLEGYEDGRIVSEAGNGIEAIELAHRLSPDVVVMDVSMPRMNSIDATRVINWGNIGVVVLGVSVRND
ncbi:MAG: response regulator transcription factor [Nitrospiraceae bacterium]